jgi:hypothetical protein
MVPFICQHSRQTYQPIRIATCSTNDTDISPALQVVRPDQVLVAPSSPSRVLLAAVTEPAAALRQYTVPHAAPTLRPGGGDAEDTMDTQSGEEDDGQVLAGAEQGPAVMVVVVGGGGAWR